MLQNSKQLNHVSDPPVKIRLGGPTWLMALTVGGSVEAKSFVFAASGGPELRGYREGQQQETSSEM